MKFFDRVLTIVITATLTSVVWIIFGGTVFEMASDRQAEETRVVDAPEPPAQRPTATITPSAPPIAVPVPTETITATPTVAPPPVPKPSPTPEAPEELVTPEA